MELLQNCRYKPGEIPESYFYEIKTQIESIIDACKEGRISVHKVEKIIDEESCYGFQYHKEVINKLDRLKVNDDPNSFRQKDMPEEMEELVKQSYNKEKGSEIEKLEKESRNIEKFLGFLYRCIQELERILKNTDYHNKRRENLKEWSIKDRPQSSSEITDNTNIQTSEMNVVNENKAHLVTLFPEFARDYPLLIKHEFLIETEKGLRKGYKISKKFLTDYFKSIKPKKPEKQKKPGELEGMPWKILEVIFGEKDLKNSASPNGKLYKEASKDFIRWLTIKKNLAGK